MTNDSDDFLTAANHHSIRFRYAFATFDANNDGTIDFDEFILAIAATSQGDLDDRLEVAFEMLVYDHQQDWG
jgi:Ca2+-binding EF-hand superfamily protein